MVLEESAPIQETLPEDLPQMKLVALLIVVCILIWLLGLVIAKRWAVLEASCRVADGPNGPEGQCTIRAYSPVDGTPQLSIGE